MAEAAVRSLIRPARRDDIDAIAAVMRASILKLGAEAYGAEGAAAWAEASVEHAPTLLEGGSFFVAEDAGRVVAVAGWSAKERRPDVAWIRAVFVHPDRAGRGLGRRVVAAAETSARAAGRAGFRVMASLNAVGFYQAIGYGEVRRLTAPLRPGVELPHVLMAKGAVADEGETGSIRVRRR